MKHDQIWCIVLWAVTLGCSLWLTMVSHNVNHKRLQRMEETIMLLERELIRLGKEVESPPLK